MSDLVKYLRTHKRHGIFSRFVANDLGQAADRIEQLERENQALEAHKGSLEAALSDILNPIPRMQRLANESGSDLNGAYAISLSENHQYLREIAADALRQLEAGRVDQSERMAHQKLIDAGVRLESKFEQYTRTNVAEMRPYVPGETLAANISISSEDKLRGSPKPGDMIARNPENHEDQWLVAKEYFENNFKKVSDD